MLTAEKSQNPMVLSYLALRRAVGAVALGLPFAVSLPWWIFHNHDFESSISSYYYTGMRNVFVGCLCAIAMFMLCARGYDRKDEIAGDLAAFCSVGVAFFPTSPDVGASELQLRVGIAHYTFAAILFLTLAYFCLFLFRLTAADKRPTRQKLQRNQVYVVCGWAILFSVAAIFILHLAKISLLFGIVRPTFCFETTSLIAFGIAWLVKGETFLKDHPHSHARRTSADTDLHVKDHATIEDHV